ncbi:protein translocase subunit SecF, partial [Arcobacter cloacae]
ATLLFFGGEIIYGFSFTLFIGIIVGTYSSIFIAATLLVQLKFSVENFKIKEIEKLKKIKEKKELRAIYEQGTI